MSFKNCPYLFCLFFFLLHHHQLLPSVALFIFPSCYFSFCFFGPELERMCPAHVSTTAIKNTGKKKKILKTHRVGRTLQPSCLSAIVSQSITIEKLKKKKRGVNKKNKKKQENKKKEDKKKKRFLSNEVTLVGVTKTTKTFGIERERKLGSISQSKNKKKDVVLRIGALDITQQQQQKENNENKQKNREVGEK